MEDSCQNFAVAGGKLITDLKVVELKAELEARGLNKYGNKRELLERLRAYLASERRANTSRPQNEASGLEVPNPWLHEEANLENDFIREYLQSQQALFRQQIGTPTAGCVPPPVSTAESLCPPATPQPHVGKKRGRKKKKKDKVASEEHEVLYSSENVSSVSATPSAPAVQHSHLRFKETALSENFINMGRTSRRRTSAAAADTENTTAATRRSSRHSSKSAAAAVSSPPPSTEDDDLPNVEASRSAEPVKNGDKADDGNHLPQDQKGQPNDLNEDRSEAKPEEDEQQGCADEGKQRARATRSRSRSVEPTTPAPAVRRSRRLSRGSSVEHSDDESASRPPAGAGAPALHTIEEQAESPEKGRSAGDEATSRAAQEEQGKEKSSSEQPELPADDRSERESVEAAASAASPHTTKPQQHFTDEEVPSDQNRDQSHQQDTKLDDEVNQNRDTSSPIKPAVAQKSDDTNGADQANEGDEEDTDKVDDGVDAVKLTLETGETLDKFDDSDEEDMSAPPATPSKRRSPQKAKRRSRSPHKKRRRSSSSSSSESSSRRRRHRRREEGSSSHRSSSSRKSRHSELSSPVKNGSDEHEPLARSPASGSKKKHSPIVLRGLPGERDDGLEGARRSNKSASSDRQQSEERDAASRKDEEPGDDFDYSSFKSARRVSLSKKLRDPDNKAKKTAAAALNSSEPSIELSSQSLKGLLPDVQPVPESELKLEEGEGEQNENTEKKKNLGSLSDSELRERKLLLQKKLQGLEEKEKQEKKLKQSSKDVESEPKKSADKEETTFSDPEEEEQALRRAAQESMRAKLAKKEELARRLDKEGDEQLPQKKKIKKDRDVREGSPLPKKAKEGREVRVVEGPAVVPRKTPSIAPARNPTSCVVIIKNLTRPFTLRQLQTLLQRTGRIVQPDGFWVDNVKSVCVARFENEDQAEETRMHLHGIQWPSSNPKTLFVDFTTQEDLEQRLKESGAPVLPQPQDQLRRKAGAVREWDRVKLGERSPGEREREKELQKRRREEGGSDEDVKRGDQRGEGRGRGRSRDWDNERHDRDRKMAKKEAASAPEKPAPKSLDDLFNKTKAKPSIYWLPLNKEQIAEKEAMRRKLMAENEKQLAALKLKHEKEREEREKQRQEREKQREAEKKERAAAAAKKKKSRSRSRKRSPKRSSRSRRRSRS